MILLLLGAAFASPWSTPCEALGRETWGRIADVVDHSAEVQTPERFHHVRVHRPLENTRLQRPVRASRDAEVGLLLCNGDWVETWHATDLTLEEVGARALVTVRGGSLLWIDAELRQVRGIVDYYVLDSRSDSERKTPVPVALGYSDVTAGRQHSIFRVEVLDPGDGEALITVSPEDDLFASTPPQGHGVSLAGLSGPAIEVPGGTASRIGEGRVLAASVDDRAAALATLAEAKRELDALAAQLWAAPPPPEAWASPERHPHRLVLQGIAQPDTITIDGQRLPPMGSRRVRGADGRAALVSIGVVPIDSGLHQVQVDTWGEPAQVRVSTDDRSAAGATIEVGRGQLPGRARWAARDSLLDPWIRPGRFELRPSLGGPGAWSEVDLQVFEDDLQAESRIDVGGHVFARLPVRLLVHGGRMWLEGTALVGTMQVREVSVRSFEATDDPFDPGVTTLMPLSSPRWLTWSAWELFAGFSGGNQLSWDLGFGVVINPKMRLSDEDPALPRPQGFVAQPAPRLALAYGTAWQVGTDATLGAGPCLVEGSCSRVHLDMGLSVLRTLGRVDPFVRAGLRSSYDIELDSPDRPTRLEGGSLGMANIAAGVIWRP